jgi:hypothetical protein
MSLSYLRADDHKQGVTHIWESRQFESMYTLQGKLNQHAIRIPHSVCVWFQTIHILPGQCIATFHIVVNSGGQRHFSWEKWLSTQFIARRLTNLWVRTQFLSQDRHWSSGGKATHCWWQATRLIGPISPACDQYVQYLLTGANPLVLNRYSRMLQPPKGLVRS